MVRSSRLRMRETVIRNSVDEAKLGLPRDEILAMLTAEVGRLAKVIEALSSDFKSIKDQSVSSRLPVGLIEAAFPPDRRRRTASSIKSDDFFDDAFTNLGRRRTDGITPVGMRALYYLAQRPGIYVNHAELAREAGSKSKKPGTIRVHMSYVRAALFNYGLGDPILTGHGSYALREDSVEQIRDFAHHV